MSRARDLSRLTSPANFTVDALNSRVGLGSTVPAAKLAVSGIVSATSFFGDGSNLEGVSSAGLGTAVDDTSEFGGQQIYFTDKVLGISGDVTVNPPDSSNIAYTQYQEISVDTGADLIISDGDDLIPDILGISSDVQTPGILAGGGGRVRADNFSDKVGTGAPTFPTGINVSGAATVSGNLTVGGVLTYADVTNIDAIGIITARSHVSIADSILHTGDTSTSIRFPAANTFTVETNGSERVRVDSTGRVKIGDDANYSASSGAKLSVELMSTAGTILEVADQTDGFSTLESVKNAGGGSSDYGGYILRGRRDSDDDAKEYLRVDSSGRLLLGTGGLSTDQDAVFQVASTSFGVAQIFRTGSAGSALHLSSTTGTLSSPAALADGDHAGYLSYRAYDGAAWRTGANIGAAADGQTWASGDCPTRLVFATTADGGTSPTERLRITSAGRIGIGTADPQGLLVIQGNSNGSTTPSIRLQDGTDSRQCAITNSSGDLILFNSGSDNTPHCKITFFDGNIFSLETANTERLRIDSNGNFIFKNGALIENGFHDDGGGLTGDYNHDLGTYGNVHFSATNAAGAFTYNLRINGSTTLNSVMAEGDVLSFTLMHASNNTSHYLTQLKIDGSNVSPVWAGGSAPSAATGSGFDVYSFSIMKTGDGTYGIFGSFTNHA